MSKVLQRIINKFITEQLRVEQQTNTNDPICDMINQTDAKIIQVGKPGTNQPGGQIQAQTALNAEKAAAIKNGAVDAFIIVTCLKTGNNVKNLYMSFLLTKLLSDISNIPFMQQYTTTQHFGLVGSLYTTRTDDDSMIIPVWIFKGTVSDYIENNLMTIKNNYITPQRSPVEILNQLLKYITTEKFGVGKTKNPDQNTNPPDPNYQEFIPISLPFKEIDESLYNKYLNLIINNPSITLNADKTAVIKTTLTNKQIAKFVTKLADDITWDITKLYSDAEFKKNHPAWDESSEGIAGIRNTLKLTILPKYEPRVNVPIAKIGSLHFILASSLLSGGIKTAPVINKLNKFFKFE